MYNPPLSKFVEGMTDELGESYITDGPKNNAYRTGDDKQVVEVKCFTLNFVASQMTFYVMKEMEFSGQEEQIIIIESRKWEIFEMSPN